jgi:16S rRNA (guanine966-N2)-methyltransferase
VRPTQDRVREALFNLLTPVLQGARFLDLFAGSGAVGLDALSRGVAEVTFLEQDKAVFNTLKKNLQAFGVDDYYAQNVNTLSWLGLADHAKPTHRKAPASMATTVNLRPYDIVFADPPYLWAKENGFAPIAEALITRNLLTAEGFLITETDYRTDALELPGFTLVRDRLYGKTRLAIYRRLA